MIKPSMKIINQLFFVLFSACCIVSCSEENIPIKNDELRIKSFKLIGGDSEMNSQVSYESNKIIINSIHSEPGSSYSEIEEYHYNENEELLYYIIKSEGFCPDTTFFDYSKAQKIVKTWHSYGREPQCTLEGTQAIAFALNNDGTYKYKSVQNRVTSFETLDGNIIARYDTTDNFKKVGTYIFDHSVETPENFKLIYSLFANDYWIDKNLVIEAKEDEYHDIEHHKYEYTFDGKGNITKVDRYISYDEIPDYRLWYTVHIMYEAVPE